MTSQIDMLRILLNHADLIFNSFRTQGDGISAEFSDPNMATIAADLASSKNWIVTRNQNKFISIEPNNTSPVEQMQNFSMYHVADRGNRDAILSSGLKLRFGGNTILNRQYSGRVHLAAQMRDAFQFVHFQITKMSNYSYGKQQNTKFPKLFVELDIFLVNVAAGTSLYNDHHFDGRGVWVDQDIPKADISLLKAEDWHPLFKAMYPDDARFYAHCVCAWSCR